MTTKLNMFFFSLPNLTNISGRSAFRDLTLLRVLPGNVLEAIACMDFLVSRANEISLCVSPLRFLSLVTESPDDTWLRKPDRGTGRAPSSPLGNWESQTLSNYSQHAQVRE